MVGGTFAANLTRVGRRPTTTIWCAGCIMRASARVLIVLYEKKDIGPEDYAKKGLPFVFDLQHSKCPNDGHELQVQNMTVMPSLRLSVDDAQDIASYLLTQKKKDPSSYPDASFMDDPKLKDEGKRWIRHFGCAGCHEISGLEDEGRIGTELTFEGSKPIERLDFALLTETAQRAETANRSRIRKISRDCRKVRRKGPWYSTTWVSSSTNWLSRTSGIKARSSRRQKSCGCPTCT